MKRPDDIDLSREDGEALIERLETEASIMGSATCSLLALKK